MVVPSPGKIIGLRCHFPQHLGAHVLELVLQFDFLGNRHTVLGEIQSGPAWFPRSRDGISLGRRDDPRVVGSGGRRCFWSARPRDARHRFELDDRRRDVKIAFNAAEFTH